MPEKNSQGQADKAETERATAAVGDDQPRSAAEKTQRADPAEVTVNPYPEYDYMTLDQLRQLAKERGVEINRDVEKAHLITELRAADTHTR